MNGTVSGSAETGRPQPAMLAAEHPAPRRRHRQAAVGAAVVLAIGAGAAGAWQAGAFSSAAPPAAGRQRPTATATRPVVREDVAATTPVAATLGYAGSYTMSGQGGGTLTWLPQAGQVISQGQVLYQTGNGSPVVLLYGTVPDWRAMSEGTTGADVAQLNHDLVTLGYADSAAVAAAGSGYYSAATATAVRQMEEHLGGAAPPGSLSLGLVEFEPTAIRVTQLTASLGGPATGPVLQATSDEHVVSIALDVSEESEVRAGNTVTITLPDGTTTTGVVSSVGTVASTMPASQSSQDGQNPATTIPVQVRLANPAAAGTLDQAPVTVNIITATAPRALAVPVTALLARSPGGYVVEVIGPHGTRRYVPVTPGIFDDSSGLVQVTGALNPGERVVVASS